MDSDGWRRKSNTVGITLSLYLNSGFVGIVQSTQLRKQRKKIWIVDCEVRSERFEWERERDEEVGELNSEFSATSSSTPKTPTSQTQSRSSPLTHGKDRKSVV